MDRDTITALAREAGGLDLLCASYGFVDTLAVFANLVAAHERKMFLKEIAMLHDSWMLASVPGHLSTKGLRIKE